MRNIRLLIEYDGTNYSGWQIQSEEATIQGTLEQGLRRLTGEEVRLTGASRTDAGVHALGQVANFRTSSSIPPRGILLGLNSILPDDIAIKGVEEAPSDFDSRRLARGKKYIYRVLNRPFPSALQRDRSWFVFHPLDTGLMREGARHLVGRKDFSSFRAADSDAPHYIREILSIDVRSVFLEADEFIEIEVRGTAFLRHMVRIIAGTLVTVGRGRLGPDEIPRIIEARNRTVAPLTAPPGGLFLKEVEY